MNLAEKFQATLSRGNMLQAQATQLELQLQATRTELAKCQGQVDLLLELDPDLPQKAPAPKNPAAVAAAAATSLVDGNGKPVEGLPEVNEPVTEANAQGLKPLEQEGQANG